MEKFAQVVGIICIAIVAIFIGTTVNGLVLVKLWSWFVVPIFKLPVLNIPQALGLGLLISMLTKPDLSSLKKEEEKKEWYVGLAKVIIAPLVTLLIGYIYLQFM
ncbi:MAG: hypothetical protein JWM20_528 [Patescibacteria group bacterium]|nr:hypothetical protein [Patescibacteria group bacterium]